MSHKVLWSREGASRYTIRALPPEQTVVKIINSLTGKQDLKYLLGLLKVQSLAWSACGTNPLAPRATWCFSARLQDRHSIIECASPTWHKRLWGCPTTGEWYNYSIAPTCSRLYTPGHSAGAHLTLDSKTGFAAGLPLWMLSLLWVCIRCILACNINRGCI